MAVCARSVLITGANRGLGLEMVRQIAALPSPPEHLLATCRNPQNAPQLQELASHHKSIKIFPLDVRQNEGFADLAGQVGDVVGEKGLTMLINNSGIFEPFVKRMPAITKEMLMNSLDVNAVAPFLLSQACLPLLKKAAKGGSGLSCNRAAIINLSAILASLAQNAGGGYAYRTSKCAANMLNLTMHQEVKKHGILVGMIHPGWVQTDMGGKQAPVTPADSVAGMLQVMASMDDKMAGKMVDYQGKTIPW